MFFCEHLSYDEGAQHDADALPDDLPDVHLDVVNDVLVEFSEMNLWMFYLNSSMLSGLFDALLGLLDDVILDVLLEPADVEIVEAHLVQLLDGDVVVDLCVEFLGADVGLELLMLSSLRLLYEDVVDVLLQVVLPSFDVQVVHMLVVV